MANYVKFRYTLEEGFPKHLIPQLIKDFIEIITPAVLVVGYETKNKVGEQTHPHLHLHFTTDKKVESIRKALTRKWKDEGETRTRAALYSLKQEEDVKDVDFFFRYPLKQGNNDYDKFNVYPDGFDKDVQMKCAIEYYNTSVMINRQKMEKELNKTSTYDKLSEYLDSLALSVNLTSNLVIKFAVQFYIDNKMAISATTIHGYCVTYCVINGIIDKCVIYEKIKSLGIL